MIARRVLLDEMDIDAIGQDAEDPDDDSDGADTNGRQRTISSAPPPVRRTLYFVPALLPPVGPEDSATVEQADSIIQV